MQKPKKVSKNVIRIDDEHWHYYINSRKKSKITGKYLFFSENKEELNNIAVDELENGGFFHAKINTDEHKKGTDYVLCLYDTDDSRKLELAEKYKENGAVKYRYWKTDADTIQGSYSEQFLKTLTPKEREEWTRNKTI